MNTVEQSSPRSPEIGMSQDINMEAALQDNIIAAADAPEPTPQLTECKPKPPTLKPKRKRSRRQAETLPTGSLSSWLTPRAEPEDSCFDGATDEECAEVLQQMKSELEMQVLVVGLWLLLGGRKQ